jgi:hypothetical protein
MTVVAHEVKPHACCAQLPYPHKGLHVSLSILNGYLCEHCMLCCIVWHLLLNHPPNTLRMLTLSLSVGYQVRALRVCAPGRLGRGTRAYDTNTSLTPASRAYTINSSLGHACAQDPRCWNNTKTLL